MKISATTTAIFCALVAHESHGFSSTQYQAVPFSSRTFQQKGHPDTQASFLNYATKTANSEDLTICSDDACEIPEDVDPGRMSVSLVPQPNGARVLRSAVVKDIYGDYVPLDRPMGKNKSVVIFLRHMG